jgi:hypothetical protein
VWAVILLGLFAYVWQGIGSHLLYYGFGVFTAYPVFSWDSAFLRSAFTTPGGTVKAAAALLAQTYRSPSLGAMAIVAVLGLLSLGVRRMLKSMHADKLRDLAWGPPILALAIYHRYDDPLPVLLAIGLSVWMAILFDSVPMRTLPARLGLFLVLFALTYHLAGAAAFLFACIIFLTEALLHRRAIVALVQAALACGGAYVLGRFFFHLGSRATYAIGTPWDPAHGLEFSPLSSLLTGVLYALVPGLILAVFLGRLATMRRRTPQPRRHAKDARQAPRWRTDDRVRLGLRLFVMAAAATLCLAVSPSHIRDERSLYYWSCRRNWDRVIALAHRMQGNRAFTPSGVFDINRALAHQGRLGEELCAYPQDETRTLFLSFENMAGRLQHAKLLELYLDLGCPNAAEKNAYELLDNEGPSPHVLEALIRIHLVKGEYESARVAFGALQRFVGCREYVRRWQDVVAEPARAQSDPLIGTWRQAQGTVDYAIAGISFEPMLKRLLKERPGHRLAFEYLMAHYLLKHQRAEFASCLPLLRPLGYSRLPRQYAEALLVHSLETKTPVNAQGWTIEPEVHAQFQEIRAVVKNARGNNQAVFDTLARQYGDSYTFYSMFNVCGAK